MIKKMSILLFFCAFAAFSNAQTIVVNISNVESDEGQLLVALHNSEENFLKKAYKSKTLNISNGKASVTFSNIPAGEYTVGVIHDRNKNGELETNFIGIPKEPVAISNNAPATYGPPKYSDAKFYVKKGEKVVQNIRFD